MKFTVKREFWARGSSKNELLLDKNGKMCCLGFLAKECGASDEDILNVPDPVSSDNINWPDGVLSEEAPSGQSRTINSIIDANDCEDLADFEIENELTYLFKEINIEVEFVD